MVPTNRTLADFSFALYWPKRLSAAKVELFPRGRRYISTLPEKRTIDWLPRHILPRGKHFRVQCAGAIMIQSF